MIIALRREISSALNSRLRSIKWLCTVSPPLSINSDDRRHSLEYSIVSALKSVSSSSSPSLFIHGLQLQCHILKSGLDSNIFVRNSLITMYSKTGRLSSAKSMFDSERKFDLVSCNIMLGGYVKSGCLNDAYELFDRMPMKNCVSYTTIMMCLAKNEFYVETVSLFKEMMSSGVFPGAVTVTIVISAYAHLDGVRNRAKLLHSFAMKLGVAKAVFVSTNLIHLYCVDSCLGDARVIFDDMNAKNVVTWNAMLNGYIKAGRIDSARELFDSMPEKDVVSWGTMINGYIQVGRLSEGLEIYGVMRRFGMNSNEVMIVDMVSACGQVSNFSGGRQFHSLALKTGFNHFDFVQSTLVHFYAACGEVEFARRQFDEGNKNHVACWNALIAGFIRNGRIDDAKFLFDEMPERDVFSWSTMIAGYSQIGPPNAALELFYKMIDDGIEPNEITMVSVLSAISSLGSLTEGRRAHDYIVRNSISINDYLSAAIVDMYAKCGSIDSALEVFNQIRDTATDVSPWNAIICGLAMHGHAAMSLRIFYDLQRRSVKPNGITFIGVLTACCHAGLVEEGERYFDSMKRVYRLEPNIKHYGCMVDLLGRAGRLKEAEEMVNGLPVKPDAVIWGALLAACKMHDDADIGERAAENLAKVEPLHGPSRVLLSNIYADAGRWTEAFLVRDAMQRRRLSRSPGYSGIV
ncbi:pentatricopeptide repeat-containing protein At5g19020, mitochondrial [Andrographis paniculata]|uniref:pentatricopeptide repeat-containing protein At5g19020, mitochondrial n=1 Tax=Andrographis paniculata TaxID=175694 RepID=UPI0021E6ECB3|nr:pentatricopeptide repeat-containing protein At5g19020, mitochondrial [Andrographis paniculata]